MAEAALAASVGSGKFFCRSAPALPEHYGKITVILIPPARSIFRTSINASRAGALSPDETIDVR